MRSNIRGDRSGPLGDQNSSFAEIHRRQEEAQASIRAEPGSTATRIRIPREVASTNWSLKHVRPTKFNNGVLAATFLFISIFQISELDHRTRAASMNIPSVYEPSRPAGGATLLCSLWSHRFCLVHSSSKHPEVADTRSAGKRPIWMKGFVLFFRGGCAVVLNFNCKWTIFSPP